MKKRIGPTVGTKRIIKVHASFKLESMFSANISPITPARKSPKLKKLNSVHNISPKSGVTNSIF